MKVFYYFIASLFVVALVACNGKKSNEAEEPQGLPVFHFEQQDSTAIRALAKDYVDRFNSGDAEGAAGMLHIIRNDSVLPLSGDQRQMMIEQIKLFSKFALSLVVNRRNFSCLVTVTTCYVLPSRLLNQVT